MKRAPGSSHLSLSGDEEEGGKVPRPGAECCCEEGGFLFGQNWSILGCLAGFGMKIKVIFIEGKNFVQTFELQISI